MANEEQLAILRQGVEVWNEWREENTKTHIDLANSDFAKANLSKANLSGANLSEAKLSQAKLSGINLGGAKLSKADLRFSDLSKANLSGANLRRAKLSRVNLSEADLSGANLNGAKLIFADLTKAKLRFSNLTKANLRGAMLIESNFSFADLTQANFRETNLTKANLSEADLSAADLSEASLSGTNLTGSTLVGTNLTGADLTYSNLVRAKISNAKISKCKIYGISVWDLEGEFDEQKELIITPHGESVITVDNIKVAQFVYLILNNKELRDVINTLTSKTVLILGRFALPERKAILDALRNKLREYDLLPIVFDFDRPTYKDFTETIKTLAGISYFVIADITNPKSSPLELQATVPDYQIPFVPIIQEGESPFAMMVDLQKKYPWVLPTRSYDSIETLMSALKPGIIDPAVEMRNKLRLVKAQEQVTESLRDYVDKSL